MDLFGYTPPAEYDQHELAGPTLHIGRKCKTCHSPIIKTESGFDSCAKGCGKLEIPKGYAQANVAGLQVPVWTKTN